MKVKVNNPEFNRPGVWFFDQPEFFEYEGEEFSAKWIMPGQLALTTGDPEWPVRVIARKNIVSINNQPVAQVSSDIRTVKVKGSKGDEYIVTVGNGKVNCTCSGFQFRRACKHVKEIENV
jgi:hypothetical protein